MSRRRWHTAASLRLPPSCAAAPSRAPPIISLSPSPSPPCPTETTTAAAASSSTTLPRALPLARVVTTPSSPSQPMASSPTAASLMASSPISLSPLRRPFTYNSKTRVAETDAWHVWRECVCAAVLKNCAAIACSRVVRQALPA